MGVGEQTTKEIVMTKQVKDTQVGMKVREFLDDNNLDLRYLAEQLGCTYEHVRNIARGGIVPAPPLTKMIARILQMNEKELEKLAVADRIRSKYGELPKELTGINPELDPIIMRWDILSEEHKQDIIALVETYSKRDRIAGKGKK